MYSCTADLTSQLDSPCKTTSIWPSICYIPLVSISIYCNFTFMSAHLYSCTTGLVLINYPYCLFDLWYVKFPGAYLTLLCHFYLHVSWFVQLHSWFDVTTGLALINYPYLTFNMLNSLVCISIYGILVFMSADLYSCMADLTSPLDLPWKTTPIWPFIC